MFVFQTDSDIVRNVYDSQHNYLIEYNEQCKDKTYCAVYFCSNDLYYPNVEDIFRKRIVEKNFFEWYNLRIEKAYKHIFVRDVFKQWYLSGINQSIDSPERLIEFLKNETDMIAPENGSLFAIQLCQFRISNLNTALAGSIQSTKHIQQRRFSRSRGSNDRSKLTTLNLQIYTI
jgi:hypothetical protein